jgi:hypothetical protein
VGTAATLGDRAAERWPRAKASKECRASNHHVRRDSIDRSPAAPGPSVASAPACSGRGSATCAAATVTPTAHGRWSSPSTGCRRRSASPGEGPLPAQAELPSAELVEVRATPSLIATVSRVILYAGRRLRDSRAIHRERFVCRTRFPWNWRRDCSEVCGQRNAFRRALGG